MFGVWLLCMLLLMKWQNWLVMLCGRSIGMIFAGCGCVSHRYPMSMQLMLHAKDFGGCTFLKEY